MPNNNHDHVIHPSHVAGPRADDGVGLIAELNFIIMLRDCAAGLLRAAHETKEESDGFSRNLLAAFVRVCAHTEYYFLRASHPDRTKILGNDHVRKVVSDLRNSTAEQTEQIGLTLKCANGFVEPEFLMADQVVCKPLLTDAAALILSLAVQLETACVKILECNQRPLSNDPLCDRKEPLEAV